MSLPLLLTSEIAYRSLVAGALDVAIFTVAIDGTVATWSAAAERIAGFESGEIIGRPVADMFEAADVARGEPDRTLDIARRTGKYKGEAWRVRRDGSRFWASVVIDALYGDDGEHIGFAQLMRDVTDRSINGERRRVIADENPHALLIVDETDTVVLGNAKAERLFGAGLGSLTGRSIGRLLTFDAGGDTTLAAHTMRTEWTGRRDDGSAVPLEIRFAVTATARGPVIVASLEDVAQRLRADEARRAAKAELLRANRLLTMAEKIAHYGHFRIDLATNEVFWSEDIYRTFGVDPGRYTPSFPTNLGLFDPAGVDVAAVLGRAVADGTPYSFESRVRRPDGTLRDVRAAGRPETDDTGRTIAIVGVLQDITDAKNAQRERERLLERLTLATEAANIGIWDWSLTSTTLTWDARMMALHGLDPAGPVPTFEAWQRMVWPPDREPVAAEIEAAIAGHKALDTEFRVVWTNGEIHTIRARGTVICNAAGEAVRMVGTNWDITEVRSLAQQLHAEKERQAAYEREQLYERERKWSTTFQRAVLPLTLPRVAGCTFDALYEPGLGDAQVGGDWYDAVHLIDGRVLVSIGDVAGSGLEAAVVVGVARQIMRGIAQLHANPMLILDAADRALSLEYPGVYVSAWVGLIDLVTRTITFASAGHPPPLLVSKDGTVRELDDATTLLIGLRENHRGRLNTVELEQGDTVVLYTDGVIEAAHDVIAGLASLREAAAVLAPAPSRRPANAIRRHVVPSGSLDDLALLVVRTDQLEAERFIERWRFDVRDANAAGAARGAFVDSLREHAFAAEDCAAAELVLCELVGNVVRHAAKTVEIEVAVDFGGPLCVLHVLDRGNGFYHVGRLPSDPYAENGRGLYLVAALSADFTVSERPGGGSHARVVLRGTKSGTASNRPILESSAATVQSVTGPA